MPEIQILSPGCEDDDCDDERERGKRGRRGHRGHRGPTGPTGPTSSPGSSGGGLLKFSGVVAPASEGGSVDSFLADFGVGLGAGDVLSLAPSYPIAVQHNVRNLAVRVLNTILGTPGGSVVFDLLRNGNPVAGFEITFPVGGLIGNQVVIAGPTTFLVGDRLDLRARATGVTAPVNVSATIGVE
jgi:hypothetical protein